MSGLVAYDKRGIPIEYGDVVKVYHFTAALRRKKHYMYKQHAGFYEWPSGNKAIKFSHLNFAQHGDRDEYYLVMLDGAMLEDYEIVQSIKCDHEERPRKK